MSGLTYSDLFSFGNVAWVSISECQLRIQKILLDFGIEDDESTKMAGTEGHWYIVSREETGKITSIQNRIRKILEIYSVPFPLVPNGRFIPDSNFKEFMQVLEEQKKLYFKAVDYLIERYDDLRKAQRPVIERQIRKVAGEDFDCSYALNRIETSAPTADQLRNKFNVREFVSAFQVPINEEVANKIEKEGDQVSDAIDKLIEGAMNPLKEKIVYLLELVSKNNRKSFTKKVINAGLRDCDMFDRKNVFGDKVITKAVSQLRTLLNQISIDIKNDDTEEFRLGLTALQSTLGEQTTKKVSKRVTRKIGSRKIL